MKKLLFLATTVLMMASCSSLRLPSAPESPSQPSRTVREKNPCEVKAEEPSQNLRAVGMARSYNETNLRSNALNNAQIQLAQMLKASIQGAIEDYSADVNKNVKVDSEAITERIMTTYIAKDVENTRVIESIIFDLSDGSIQMYVCAEMGKPQTQVEEEVSDALSQDDVLGVKFDRERFKKSMSEGLEEYKRNNR